MDGKIYVRSSGKTLSQCSYSCSNTDVLYHRQLYGRRHYALKKSDTKKCQKNGKSKTDKTVPLSLYESCQEFIVENLHLVDTFDGLPSLVAEELFGAAINRDVFSSSKNNDLLNVIQLFTNTYGHEMFQSLCLCQKGMFVAQHLDELFLLLPYLHSVKLSKCGIGDEHEILFELGKLHLLKNLSLDSNNFGDVGVKNLVQTYRRAKKGFESLELLNLSQNHKCTAISLSFIALIPNLKAFSITVSRTHIDKYVSSKKFSLSCPNLIEHAKYLDAFSSSGENFVTGWGNVLLEKWIRDFMFHEKQSTAHSVAKLKKNFYYNVGVPVPEAKYSLSTKRIAQMKQKVVSEDNFTTLTLCSCKPEISSQSNPKKRKYESNTASTLKRSKLEEIFPESDEEINLLSKYSVS